MSNIPRCPSCGATGPAGEDWTCCTCPKPAPSAKRADFTANPPIMGGGLSPAEWLRSIANADEKKGANMRAQEARAIADWIDQRGWQPIDTAPKDGTLIMLWLNPIEEGLIREAPKTGEELNKIVFATYPHERRGHWDGRRLRTYRKLDPEIPDWLGWTVASASYQPTHWRPIQGPKT